jgi:hypothetical protein
MSGREEALELLQAARRDLRALRAMMDPAVVAEEIFGFHVQQTVEKAVAVVQVVAAQVEGAP